MVVFRAPPPAVLATERTRVPRPDFVRSAVEVSGEPIVAVTTPVSAAPEGFWTKTTYSLVEPTATPASNPPSVRPMASEPAVALVAVKSSAPELTVSACPAPVPLTPTVAAVVLALFSTKALIVRPLMAVRSAVSDSRTFSVEAAKESAAYSVVRSRGRRPAPLPAATT